MDDPAKSDCAGNMERGTEGPGHTKTKDAKEERKRGSHRREIRWHSLRSLFFVLPRLNMNNNLIVIDGRMEDYTMDMR